QKVTHFIPPPFPVLLLAPALCLDLLFERLKGRSKWLQASVAGVVFVAALIAVEWPMANFLLSPWARNWFFGAHYLDYTTRPTSPLARFVFSDRMDQGPMTF